ncbi:cell wall elongation regulator TseB-like domain-containing protein [Gorillibacterium timonense]|uniref:cell wall elongation regulator TseB-like domain-containing protein n=1 Tax=Gorillibacterium timonense TaxID=1689269 RepID=UPI00071DA183|nr:DUF5590 domain-containing protein [Gorillibacterium timonense]
MAAIRVSSRSRGGRSGRRTGTKITLLVLVLLGLILFLGYRFYLSVQKDIWTEEDVAIEMAMKQTSLKSVSRVDPFVGDTSMMIVQGADDQGRAMFVWVSGEAVHTEYADDGVTKESIRSKTLEANPGAELLRIVPAVYNGEYAWQSFYRVKEEGGKKLYYSYFRFKDGELLDKWLLSLQ